MKPFEKPNPKGQIIDFPQKDAPAQMPPSSQQEADDDALIEPPADFQAIRAANIDEHAATAHTKLAEKFRKQREATNRFDAFIEKPVPVDLNAAVRKLVIELDMHERGVSRSVAERELDTEMLSERAQADMDETEFIALRKMPKDEADERLEAAYAEAKRKYGEMYPAADPTMFYRFKHLEALLSKERARRDREEATATPTPQSPYSPPSPQSLTNRIRDWFNKLFS